MAAIPGTAVAAGTAAGTSVVASTALNFVVSLGSSYLLSRLSAQDGPRLKDKSASGGEYGVGMPRLFGTEVRQPGIFIAQADIKERKHTVGSTAANVAIGAVTGAAQGFLIGGPVGAAIGAVAGGLLGLAAPKQHYYTYDDTFSMMVADRFGDDPVEGIDRVFANGKLIFSASQLSVVGSAFDGGGKLIWRKYGKTKFFKSLTFYTGHTDQPVDPILTAAVDEDCAYPYSAHCVFESLQLAPFGNSLPSELDILVKVKAGQTLADAVEWMCEQASIDADLEMSSTAFIGKTLRGYSLTSESTCWDALKPLLPVFGVDVAEVSGQIRCYRRFQALRATIPLDDMGAHVYGDDPPERIRFRRDTDLRLPQETALTFIDPNRNYQANTATARRSEGSASSNIAITVPLVITADEGASAAALMHWDAWLGRTAASLTLTDAWIGLDAGLAYAIPFGDQYLPYRVARKTRGANGIIEVEVLSDEQVTYTAVVAGETGTLPDDPDITLPTTRLILIDMPITSDAHDDFGFYIAIAGSAPDWTRGHVDISGDGGANWGTVLDSDLAAIMGDVTGTLAAGTTTGLDDTLDTTTVLTVVLLHSGMTLTSATDAELDAWANCVFVGKNGMGEYLQFKTATQIDAVTWELTNLRRGRRGTDWALGLHASGEEFVLLGGEGVFRYVYSDDSQWGVPILFRGVTLHDDDAEDAVEQTFANTGEGKRPFSPVNVQPTWGGSYDLTGTFDRRSRLFTGALGEATEAYEIDILDPGDLTTVLRTINAITETFDYDAVDQVADGLTPGQTIYGNIYQMSAVRGRGHPRFFALIGPLSIGASETDTSLALAMVVLGTTGLATETDTAFALTGGPVGHRYWRVNVSAVSGGSTTLVEELEFRTAIGGADVTGSGTAIGSGASQANAFDNNTATSWNPSGTSNWIGYDFGVGNEKAIVEIAIGTSASTAFTALPKDFTIEWSDDGSSWTVHDTCHAYGWLANATRAFPEAAPAAGFHRFWRLFCTDNNGGSTFIVLDDIQFRATSGGADQTSTQSATSGDATGRAIGSNGGGSDQAWKCFDSNVSGADPYFMTATANTWAGYIFPSPVQVQEILAQCYTNTGRAPNHAQVEYSDDGVTWTNQKSITFGTWTSLEQKVVAAI